MTEPTRTLTVPWLLRLILAIVFALALGLIGNVYHFTGDIRPYQVIGMIADGIIIAIALLV